MTSAAQAWLGEALRHHGEALDDGRMRIRRSQAALARDAECSAGTIAYYLHDLGDEVSFSRDEGVVVANSTAAGETDELAHKRCRSGQVAQALDQAFGRAPERGWAQLADPAGRAPTIRQMAIAVGLSPSTLQRHVDRLLATDQLRRRGRYLSLRVGPDDTPQPHEPPHDHQGPETRPVWTGASPGPQLVDLSLVVSLATALVGVARDLARLGEGLLASLGQSEAAPREAATARAQDRGNPRYDCAPTAGNRDCAHSVADPFSSKGIEKTEDLLSSTPGDPRTGARSTQLSRGTDAPRATTARTAVLSSAEDIATALAPLRRCCERLTLPTVVDEEGRRWLALYSPAELARAVTQVTRMAEANQQRLRSPMGLLVQRAKQGEEALFEPAPERPQPVTAVPEQPAPLVDAEAARAIAAMADDELARLDAQVQARLTANQRGRSTGIDRIMGDEDTLATWRHTLWRETQSAPADEENTGGHG